ncbi:hypothetical protein, variant [Verruconis gallopava]|uniref:P-loop containing nucleoside triphosphate hydrolase protein n=1 Tax=Verruconis gallopava TaxID=253628 RepID=A0A0D2BAA8_9PEZI|nr:hypothetical protein, variant [Verruconis gallopava]KIW08254.1 hypothetical protein, variant [Verruconis gallopava]
MQRWLQMATAHTLRCRRPLWTSLGRRSSPSPSCRQVRTAAHLATAQSPLDETRSIVSNAGEGSQDVNRSWRKSAIWYRVRDHEIEKPLRDLSYYSRLPHFPKPESYGDLAKEIFDCPPRAEVMSAVTASLKSRHILSEWKELSRRPERIIWRHNFLIQIGKDKVQVVGEGITPDAAYAAAFLSLVYRLHVLGMLKDVFGKGVSKEVLDVQKHEFEWNPSDVAAKLHIHNFAARYLRTPQVIFEDHHSGTIKATVAIPDTTYIASACAGDRREAEFLAYAALKHVIQVDLGRDGHWIDLQDNAYVNLDNSSSILDLYKLKERYGHYQRLDECVPGPRSSTWTASRLYWDNRPISEFHEMPTRRDAMKLAALEAAVRLVRRQPALFDEFLVMSKQNAGFIPKRVSPTFASLNPAVVNALSECVEAADDMDLASFQLSKYTPGYKPVIGRRRGRVKATAGDRYHSIAQSLAARSDELRLQQEWDRENPEFAEKLAARARLPIYQHKAQIIAMVKNHDQCIIVGSTGSGKSTQVPQIILDDAIAEGRGALCNIMCVQPRRLACVALALTVCNERERELGDVVGYRIGGDYFNYSKRGGSITYCTTELLANELERTEDELPHNLSHIIIDEIHERSVHLDRLLSTIKMTFSKRLAMGLRVPKLILMSATVESDLFERYFEMISQDGTIIRPPYLNVPGHMFKTETKFLESYAHHLPPEIYQAVQRMDLHQSPVDKSHSFLEPVVEKPKQVVQWDSLFQQSNGKLANDDNILAVAAAIVHIVETTRGGAILAFVPGAQEIRRVHRILLDTKRVNFSDKNRFEILMLHRSNPAHLVAALDTVPKGVRRIMIATNIAESSITFPDVEFVVDSGLQRNVSDSVFGDMQMLRDERISRSSVLQRAGRAGRTKPGQYYSALTTEEMQSLDVLPNSEDMDRHRLEGLYLRAKIHFPAVSVQEYFSSYLKPIPSTKVQAAESYLHNIGALDASGDVSLIGYFLYRTTLAPCFARVVMLGILFRCLDRAVVLANLMALRSYLFGDSRFDSKSPSERRATAEQYAGNMEGDLIAQVRAYEEYTAIQRTDTSAVREWAEQRQLVVEYFDQLQVRVDATRDVLRKAGFYTHRWGHDINASANNVTLLKLLICAGSYPNVAIHQRGPNFVTHESLVVKPAPASVALPGDYTKRETYDSIHEGLTGAIFCYKDVFVGRRGANKYYIANLTPISPLMLALFSSNVKPAPQKHNQLIIDNFIPLKFAGDASASRIFLDFKKVFDTALLAGMQNICEIWPTDRRKVLLTDLSDVILTAVQELLEYEEGQARRRARDVGRFSLGPEKEAWGDDVASEEMKKTPGVPSQVSRLHNHLYDRTALDSRGFGANAAKATVTWRPDAFDDEDIEDFTELEGDLDHR